MDDSVLMARPRAEIGRLGSQSLMIGGIGVIGLVAGFLTSRDTFMQSYLIAFIFWLGLTMGSLAVMMIHYLSGGAWGMVGRRVWEAAAKNFPLMALLFLPIAFNLPALYAWARPEAATDPLIQPKAAYLNPGFFYIRAAVMFAIWMALTFTLTRWSREQDENPRLLPGPQDRRSRVVSGPGLVLYVLTVTIMSVDWIMSLDPHWYSTIFGILMLGGQGLATLAFTILVLSMLVRFQPMSNVATPENFHDLGKLMFAFVMLWAYFSVSQLIIIWSGNLPEEIPFYLERLHGPWQAVSIVILLLEFTLPFLLLLSRRFKRSPRAVARIAVLILVMRVVDIAWLIGPVFRTGSSLHWLDFAAVLGLGCLWLPLFFRNLAGRPLVPAHDPYFEEAMANAGH